MIRFKKNPVLFISVMYVLMSVIHLFAMHAEQEVEEFKEKIRILETCDL